MDKWLAILVTVAAGSLVALQAPINGMLGRTVGSLAAASVSFAIGLAVLVAITLVAGGGFGQVGEIQGLSWYYLTGGVLGAIYVTTVLITVRELGAGSVTAATERSFSFFSVLRGPGPGSWGPGSSKASGGRSWWSKRAIRGC